MTNTPLRNHFSTLSLAGACLAALAFALPSAPAQANERAFTHDADSADLEWGPCPDFMPEGCGIAVLQGDPAGENADIFYRLPAGTTAARHYHTSSERMMLAAGEMVVDYDGQDPVTLKPGIYAYGPPELPHTAECISTEACILFITFEEPLDAMPGAPE